METQQVFTFLFTMLQLILHEFEPIKSIHIILYMAHSYKTIKHIFFGEILLKYCLHLSKSVILLIRVNEHDSCVV